MNLWDGWQFVIGTFHFTWGTEYSLEDAHDHFHWILFPRLISAVISPFQKLNYIFSILIWCLQSSLLCKIYPLFIAPEITFICKYVALLSFEMHLHILRGFPTTCPYTIFFFPAFLSFIFLFTSSIMTLLINSCFRTFFALM